MSDKKNTNVVAIYARYSCDQQRETSIDDQVRRCKEIAEYIGIVASEWLIFTDSAISGLAYAQDKREGYRDLENAWSQGKFDILVVDAFERLARDGVEQARLIERLNTNRRVRLITADGVDSAREGWDLTLRIKGAISIAENANLRHRVTRGMVGQLERGYMIATPAFGYDLKREYDARGNRVGTHWTINEQEAEWVRQIFDCRKNGQSMTKIAEWLNGLGVPCARNGRTAEGGYWRPARIRGLLQNPIYRGEFVWHGSSGFKKKAEERGEPVVERSYLHPELRLVTDEVWHRCNPKKTSRSNYGGGKNALAGLITCSCCGGTLVLTSKSRCRSVYCANCTIAKSCTTNKDRLSVTVATVGVEKLLVESLGYFLTPDFITLFRQELHDRLTAGSRHEYDLCENELKRLQKIRAKLSHMLANVDGDDDVLEARYEETRRLVEVAQSRLEMLGSSVADIDEHAVAAQLSVDPASVLKGIFEADIPPEQLREVLRRLFPSIVLEGKQGRYQSVFKIRFSPGAALAIASNTGYQVDGALECRFLLRYVPAYRASEGPRWEVGRLPDLDYADSMHKGGVVQ